MSSHKQELQERKKCVFYWVWAITDFKNKPEIIKCYYKHARKTLSSQQEGRTKHMTLDLFEKKSRDSFIEQMKPFLTAHGTPNTDVNGLLDYACQKGRVRFNIHGCDWSTDQDTIKYRYEWYACNFFDDIEDKGRYDWSFTFVAYTGIYLIQNEMLNDISHYDVRSNAPAVDDLFYCKDPFGLKGIYEVHFHGFQDIIS